MRANPAASSPLLAQALLSLGLVAIASPAVVLVAMPRHPAFVVVVVALPGPAGTELYILAKLVLIIAIPSVAVGLLRPAVTFDRPRVASRVSVPLAMIVVWALLAKVAPWTPTHDYSGVDPMLLPTAGLATAVTAGVGEELFYRRWLQPRLEALPRALTDHRDPRADRRLGHRIGDPRLTLECRMGGQSDAR